jgi:hypothetical protein
MAARYQHIVAAVRRNVANQVGGLLWQTDGTDEADRDQADELQHPIT